MGHQLTSVTVTVAGAGLYSCVTVREPAWHTLGVNFADRAGLTVDEALTEAHQNFTVRTVPVATTPDDRAAAVASRHLRRARVAAMALPAPRAGRGARKWYARKDDRDVVIKQNT